MKSRIVFPALVFSLVLAIAAQAAEKKGEWVRIPGKWLLHRFVRSSAAPSHTYKVALAFPAKSDAARIAQSSGSNDIDRVAADFALESIRSNRALSDLSKSKELFFQLVMTPPALDIKMRSKEGQRPAPPDKELYMPLSSTFFFDPNQNERTSRNGQMVVVFPPLGGYASESIVTISTGNPAVDRYFLHHSVLNWQTTRKSDKEQILRMPFNAVAPQRWESILDR